jgi:sugar phosphate isomerase/epimerase
MKESIRKFARLGVVHHMLYPESVNDPAFHVETLAALAERDDIDALDCFLPVGSDNQEQLIPVLRSSGKKIAGSSHPELKHGISLTSSDQAEQIRCREIIAGQISCSVKMGASSFIFSSGSQSGDRDESIRAFTGFCRWISGELAAQRMSALLEPFDTAVDKQYLYGPTGMCVDLIRILEPEVANFGILLDFAHLPLMGEHSIQAVHTVRPYLKRVHLGNCVLADSTNPWYGDTHPPIGFPGGEIGTPELAEQLEVLVETGYLSKENRGTLVFEMRPFPGMTAEETLDDAMTRLADAWVTV